MVRGVFPINVNPLKLNPTPETLIFETSMVHLNKQTKFYDNKRYVKVWQKTNLETRPLNCKNLFCSIVDHISLQEPTVIILMRASLHFKKVVGVVLWLLCVTPFQKTLFHLIQRLTWPVIYLYPLVYLLDAIDHQSVHTTSWLSL